MKVVLFLCSGELPPVTGSTGALVVEVSPTIAVTVADANRSALLNSIDT